MQNKRIVIIAVVLAIMVAGQAIWLIVLQRRIVDLRAANAELAQRLESSEKAVTPRPLLNGFHDLRFAEAIGKAKIDGKPLMAFFHSKSSGPSKGMEDSTWKDASVHEWLQKRTIAIRVDADTEPDLAVANGITGLPVTIFFRPDRTEIGRIVGFHSPVDFLQQATSIIDEEE